MELIKNTDERIGPVVIQHHLDGGIIHTIPGEKKKKKISHWKKKNKLKIDEAEQRILDRVYRRSGA